MARNKKKIIFLIFFIVLFWGFTLKNDTYEPLKKDKISLVLTSIYNFYKNNHIFQFSFNERVYIPFLEKWNSFSGHGYYQIGTNKFNIFFQNKSNDHYISDGKKIYYFFNIDGKKNSNTFDLNNNWLTYLFPSKDNYEIFTKQLFINDKNEYLLILTPTLNKFPLKKIEFVFYKKNFYLKEVAITGNDDRILYFNIKKIKKITLSQSKIEQLFSHEK